MVIILENKYYIWSLLELQHSSVWFGDPSLLALSSTEHVVRIRAQSRLRWWTTIHWILVNKLGDYCTLLPCCRLRMEAEVARDKTIKSNLSGKGGTDINYWWLLCYWRLQIHAAVCSVAADASARWTRRGTRSAFASGNAADITN